MVFVQETKLESVERIEIQRIWGSSYMEFTSSSAVGAYGGLLIIWNNDIFKEENAIIQRHFIVLQGALYGFPCILVNAYAPNDVRSRRTLWEDIFAIKANSQIPRCVGGYLMRLKM